MRSNRRYPIGFQLFVVWLIFCQMSCRARERHAQWFVEVENDCQEAFCQELFASMLNKLHGQTYLLTTEGEITRLEKNIPINNRDKDFPLHQFFVLDKKRAPKAENGKVFLRFYPQNNEGRYSANMLVFLYQKDGSWNRVLNPGKFTFKKEITTQKLEERLQQLIVTVTYK